MGKKNRNTKEKRVTEPSVEAPASRPPLADHPAGSGTGVQTPHFQVVTAHAEQQNILMKIKESRVIGLEIDTSGPDPRKDKLFQIAVTDEQEHVSVFDVSNSTLPVKQILTPLLDSPGKCVVHGAKRQLKFAMHENIPIQREIVDLELIEQILTTGLQPDGFDMSSLLLKYYGIELSHPEGLTRVGQFSEGRSRPELTRRCRNLPFLFSVMAPFLAREPYGNIIRVEHLFLPAVAAMELNGIGIDSENWSDFIDGVKRVVTELKRSVRTMRYFDVDSCEESFRQWVAQGQVDMARLGDCPQHTHDLGWGDLLFIRSKRAEAAFAQMSKFEATWHNPETGRFHLPYDQLDNRSGALRSCFSRNPLFGRWSLLRKCQIPAPGSVLVSAEFPHLILRLAADRFKDKKLLALLDEQTGTADEALVSLFSQSIKGMSKISALEARAIGDGLAFGWHGDELMDYLFMTHGVALKDGAADALAAAMDKSFPEFAKSKAHRNSMQIWGVMTFAERMAQTRTDPEIADWNRFNYVGGAQAIVKLFMGLIHVRLPQIGGKLVSCFNGSPCAEVPQESQSDAHEMFKAVFDEIFVKHIRVATRPRIDVSTLADLPGGR